MRKERCKLQWAFERTDPAFGSNYLSKGIGHYRFLRGCNVIFLETCLLEKLPPLFMCHRPERLPCQIADRLLKIFIRFVLPSKLQRYIFPPSSGTWKFAYCPPLLELQRNRLNVGSIKFRIIKRKILYDGLQYGNSIREPVLMHSVMCHFDHLSAAINSNSLAFFAKYQSNQIPSSSIANSQKHNRLV